jgi:hypothetical protein
MASRGGHTGLCLRPMASVREGLETVKKVHRPLRAWFCAPDLSYQQPSQQAGARRGQEEALERATANSLRFK